MAQKYDSITERLITERLMKKDRENAQATDADDPLRGEGEDPPAPRLFYEIDEIKNDSDQDKDSGSIKIKGLKIEFNCHVDRDENDYPIKQASVKSISIDEVDAWATTAEIKSIISSVIPKIIISSISDNAGHELKEIENLYIAVDSDLSTSVEEDGELSDKEYDLLHQIIDYEMTNKGFGKKESEGGYDNHENPYDAIIDDRARMNQVNSRGLGRGLGRGAVGRGVPKEAGIIGQRNKKIDENRDGSQFYEIKGDNE